jgi:hypothetical protein
MEDYSAASKAVCEEEKQAYQRIYRSALAKKLSTGTVHLYFVSPDGEALDTIHVAHAKTLKVLETAKSVIEKLGTPEGKTLVEPRPQAAWPKAEEGAISLHLVARGVPGKVGGFWQELPGEDFITFTREEQSTFPPPAEAKVGGTWEVDRTVALKLLNRFYPSTENNDVQKNEVERMSMRATLLGPGKVRLDASLRMKHPFYHKKDEATVDLVAVGVVDVDGSRVVRFRMATQTATYNGGTFGVAVRSAQ